MAIRNFFTYTEVYVPKAVKRRYQMIAEEIMTFNPRTPIEDGDDVATLVLTEFARQHFEESTKAVVNLIRQHPDDSSLLRLL